MLENPKTFTNLFDLNNRLALNNTIFNSVNYSILLCIGVCRIEITNSIQINRTQLLIRLETKQARLTVIITSFGQWQPMQNYLKLDEHSWSAKLMQFWRRLDFLFFINVEGTISVKKSLSEHQKIQFIKIYFFSFFQTFRFFV